MLRARSGCGPQVTCPVDAPTNQDHDPWKDRTSALVVAFIEQARDVGIGEKLYLEVAPDDLLKIAGHPAARAEFRRSLDQINDPQLRAQIVQHVLDLADSMDENAAGADRKVDLVDRAGLSVAGSVTATGIGTTVLTVGKVVGTGAMLGPVGVLAGGLIGLVAVASGRHILKRRADESKSAGRKLRRLVG